MNEGTKFDQGKAPLSMLPWVAIEQIAQVLAYGAHKYGRDNWLQGMKLTRVVDAALRHTYKWAWGEDIDEESGLPHLAHAAVNLLFLLTYTQAKVGTDDRIKIPKIAYLATPVIIALPRPEQ